MALVAMVLAIGLMAGCGDPGQGGTQPTGDQASPEGAVGQSQVQADPSSSAQTNANSDRTLYGAANQVNTTFDPWGVINSYDNLGRIQVFNTLVFKNDAGEIVGSLAKDWEWSEDAMQITFNLHQGVKFHNGEELKASDVKFSLDTARQSPTCATYLTSIEHIETPDDYTVIVKLNKPNVALLEVLMTFGLIVHEGSYSAAGDLAGDTLESVIGTGPYRLTEWKPTEIMVFESFDDYFEGAPSIKNLSIKTISDPNTAIIALQTGDIDIYFQSVPAISIGTLKSNDSLTVVDITSKRLFYMGINWEFGPFASNPKLREAVAYGVDRNALNMIANEGLGTIVYYPGGPDYSGQPNVKNTGYQFDPDKARELVKEVGAEGLEFSIKLENSGVLPELATMLQSQLSAIGLNPSITILEVNAYLQDVYSDGLYDIFISFTTARTKDMDTVWTNLFHSANIGQGNSGRYINPKMDAIIENGRAETGSEKRKEIYADGVAIYDQDIPYLSLFYEYSNRAFSSVLDTDHTMAEYDCVYYYTWK